MATGSMASDSGKERHTLIGEHVYDGLTLSSLFPARVLDKVKTFPFADDDILIATYPKSGTTWMQEIVYLVCHPEKFETAKTTIQDDRIPFLEAAKPPKQDDVDILLEREPPRFIKTHLPYTMLKTLEGKKTKMIVVMRNVKDVLVSYFHFYKSVQSFGPFRGTWEEYFDLFKENRICHGSWFDFNLSYWNIRHQENVFSVKYEDMQKDIHVVIKNVAKFLGKDIDSKMVEKIADHTNFDSMKGNPMVNKSWSTGIDQNVSPFLRKGKVGDWKTHFTVAQNEYTDALLDEKFHGSGLEFEH